MQEEILLLRRMDSIVLAEAGIVEKDVRIKRLPLLELLVPILLGHEVVFGW